MTVTAKVIADSASPDGVRLTTLHLRYPKFIHGEFMTHRVFSRNASSSRAIPVERLIGDVLDDPVVPMHWGKNQSGRQADEQNVAGPEWQLPEGSMTPVWTGLATGNATPEQAWCLARNNAIDLARNFVERGYHKQIVNRLLEPFCHINVVVTATEWSNFFALRCHRDAQPEMRALAEAMRDAMAASEPQGLQLGEWHLPYIEEPHYGQHIDAVGTPRDIKISAARCARVSYLTQEGRVPTVEEDLALYERLVGSAPLHASPCEHQATPDTLTGKINQWLSPHHGNLRGWVQYRKTLPGECAP